MDIRCGSDGIAVVRLTKTFYGTDAIGTMVNDDIWILKNMGDDTYKAKIWDVVILN